MSAEELRAFVQPDETAWHLAQRARYDPIRSGLAALGNLRAAQIVEISGPSGAGKSELLIQVKQHLTIFHLITKVSRLP